MTYAAAIAYHALFSFFPLILILLGVGGAFVRTHQLQPHIIESVRLYLPVGSDFVEDNLRTITASSGKISLFAIVLLAWTASGAFMPLELALNQAWGVKKERGFLHRRIVAALMVLLCGYLILASVFSTVMLGRVPRFVQHFSEDRWVSSTTTITVEVLVVFISFALMVLMFMLIYKFVPYTHIRFSQVTPAAILAALTWESAKDVFTFFLHYSNYKNVYGSIATIIAILTWVYVSAGILLFFAEYSTQMRSKRKQ
jgi:YihY family inner membrane protein